MKNILHFTALILAVSMLFGCAPSADAASASSAEALQPVQSEDAEIAAPAQPFYMKENMLYASTLSQTAEQQTVRVLIIKQDPLLDTGIINGADCTGKTASAALGQNADAAGGFRLCRISRGARTADTVIIGGTIYTPPIIAQTFTPNRPR